MQNVSRMVSGATKDYYKKSVETIFCVYISSVLALANKKGTVGRGDEDSFVQRLLCKVQLEIFCLYNKKKTKKVLHNTLVQIIIYECI